MYCKRKRKSLFTDAPNTERNAFQLILEALNVWCSIYEKCNEWEICSAGESHENISLNNEQTLVSLGKLTLDDYARAMMESYVGISLMVSPHPSYPPLEMSTFGIKTITNCYENKDLSQFNDNIISLHSCSADNIANVLKEICSNYSGYGKIIKDSEYVIKSKEFDDIPKSLIELLGV